MLGRRRFRGKREKEEHRILMVSDILKFYKIGKYSIFLCGMHSWRVLYLCQTFMPNLAWFILLS